ncbi:MAG: DUF6516 family protein [Caldilineaceae bacterium]
MNMLVEQLLSILHSHSLVRDVRLLNYDETPMGKLEVKIRCRLSAGLQLQIWLHHETAFQDYAYQLFTNQPIWRWDNAPHYPHISTAPHHFHDENGNVCESPLTGDTIADLNFILQESERWLSQSRK